MSAWEQHRRERAAEDACAQEEWERECHLAEVQEAEEEAEREREAELIAALPPELRPTSSLRRCRSSSPTDDFALSYGLDDNAWDYAEEQELDRWRY